MALSLAGTLTDLNLKAACYNVGNRQHGTLQICKPWHIEIDNLG